MPYTHEQLKRLFEDMPAGLAVYPPNRGGSNVDDVQLVGVDRKAPDGTVQRELALGVILYDRTAVAFPVIEVLKFAIQHHPDLLERAQAELKTAAAA